VCVCACVHVETFMHKSLAVLFITGAASATTIYLVHQGQAQEHANIRKGVVRDAVLLRWKEEEAANGLRRTKRVS